MKKTFFLFVILLFNLSQAQDAIVIKDEGFEKLLREHVALLDQAGDQQTYEKMLFKFNRLKNLEEDKWLPLYYSVYCTVVLSRWKSDDDLVYSMEEALRHIEKVKTLKPNNPEALALESRIYLRLIQEKPMAFGPKYIHKLKESLNIALKLDKTNPRVFLTYGMYYYYFPAIMGGDKEKGCLMFNKATGLYLDEESQMTSDTQEVLPHWGKELNAWYVNANKCK